MNKLQYEIVRPDPEKEINSMRSFGYSLETAIADLIDNSVTAEANKIFITYNIAIFGSYVRIEDNGKGMSEAGLINAMKLGSFNPVDIRMQGDLGRFGFGLKTASFSQCRRLSVLSNNGISSSFRAWDLDKIQEEKEWILYKTPIDDYSTAKLGNLKENTGTIVLWEKLDRLAETGNPATDKNNFYRKFENVKKYLGLVFHRLMENKSLAIFINGEPVISVNPFIISHDKPSQELQESFFTINNSIITVKPYILPHESKLSKSEARRYDLVRSWIEHQGIYLYRNNRLIIDGSWMDLKFRQRESQRLVRICVDINNELDKEWQIDVKKASAKVPDLIRNNIISICADTIAKGIKVYTHRGTYVRRKGEKKEILYTWIARSRKGEKFYQINPEHPLFVLLSDMLGDNSSIFSSYIKIIESTIPIGMILNDAYDENITLAHPEAEEEIKKLYSGLISVMVAAGMGIADAEDALKVTDMFNKYSNKL
ncbi:ATP-binding protein [Bacteroides oleiciplenus]|uniref:ATP-binding protein n=1 Tax=Bacteroides oleiciplenus TaxID=626931 RepID=A0A3E5BKM9_9BACE|nr:ATP-binding protein [Bacteroides oleiciplenus]RGN38141.1 ATP-binding protein [Bacteroides oleiciplenus]